MSSQKSLILNYAIQALAAFESVDVIVEPVSMAAVVVAVAYRKKFKELDIVCRASVDQCKSAAANIVSIKPAEAIVPCVGGDWRIKYVAVS